MYSVCGHAVITCIAETSTRNTCTSDKHICAFRMIIMQRKVLIVLHVGTFLVISFLVIIIRF